MDRIDQRLLSSLQEDSRRSIAELAEQVALSTSACHRRIKQLEDSGFIQGYGARVDGKKLGYAMEFFIEVSLETQHEEALTRFESSVKEIPEILECFLMTGESDYILRIAVKDTEDYERFYRETLGKMPGVSRIQSSLVLRTINRRTGYVIRPGDV